MKTMFVWSALLMFAVGFSQGIAPKHEVVDNLVKSTYYHDNGQIAQQGYYKNGKVHGQWVSYDAAGNKVAMGTYNEGEKTGKWFFWNQNSLSEVDYSSSRVAKVKSWKQDAVVVRN
jgi:antitoxin component YwqK of YwqJK toxin-antitoxin module